MLSQKCLGLVVSFVAVAALVIFLSSFESSIGEGEAESPGLLSKKCMDVCAKRSNRRLSGGFSSSSLVKKVKKARHDILKTVEKQYGEEYTRLLFEQMEEDVEDEDALLKRAKYIFKAPGGKDGVSSVERLQRKLMMKILMVYANSGKKSKHHPVKLSNERCDCSKSSMNIRRDLQEENEVTYVWATGGHSAAAGHGNLYNESYTAFAERVAQPVFESLGIRFEGRNYAMGGMASAPELALCLNSVYGPDIDALVWDYGMTDGPLYELAEHYAFRAGLMPNTPTVFLYGTDVPDTRSDDVKGRVGIMHDLQYRGMSTFAFDDKSYRDATSYIPDMAKMPVEEFSKVPEFLKYLKCNNKAEKGDPGCGDHKYTNDKFCPDRNYMASWHPGWKYHALKGTFTGLFLVEQLYQAAVTLHDITTHKIPIDSVNGADPSSILRYFQQLEDDDRKEFLDSTYPSPAVGEVNGDEVAELFYRTPSICHTQLLPSHQDKVLGGGLDHAEGITMDQYKEETGLNIDDPAEAQPMKLIKDERSRQVCDYELNRDHKDYYFISDTDGWSSITVPSDEALKEYATGDKSKGAIILCQTTCDWGECPEGDLMLSAVEEGDLTITVNGKEVTSVVQLSERNRCFYIAGKKGLYSWGKNERNPQYEIKTRVNKENSALRLSSFILL